MSALKLKRKHAQIVHEMQLFKPQLEEVVQTADQLMNDDHFASDTIDEEKQKVVNEWAKLEDLAADREKVLNNSIASHSYIMEANEAQNWLKEKQDNLDSKNQKPWPKNIDELLVSFETVWRTVIETVVFSRRFFLKEKKHDYYSG